jgi:hypothetical protein
MDWLIFILSVIEAIAWPVAFVAAVVFLRQEWVDVIGRIQGTKHKEIQTEFGHRLQEASKKAKSSLPDSVDLASKGLAHRLELAGYSPRGAILESWIDVEASLEELGARYEIPRDELKHPDIHMMELRLGEDNALGKGAFSLLQSLCEMRNEAFYLTNKVIESDAAKEYVSLANRMATLLKEA